MFLGWKNQYCKHNCTTQYNLQIQCNPYPSTNGIFSQKYNKNFIICMEAIKILKNQSNLKKNGAGGISLPDFKLQNVLLMNLLSPWGFPVVRNPVVKKSQ